MALITSNQSRRLNIPHEPGQWIEVRPLRAGDMGLLVMQDGQVQVSYELLGAILVAWSYGDVPTDQSSKVALVEQLDLDTYLWMYKELATLLPEISGIRSDEEKKESASPSSATTDQVEAVSPSNLVASQS